MNTLQALITEIDDLESRLRVARHRFSQEKRLYCNERGITFLRDEQLRNEIMGDAADRRRSAALTGRACFTSRRCRAAAAIAGGKRG